MGNATTPEGIADALSAIFLPKLIECEDLDVFERILIRDTRSLAADCMRRCIEAFGESLVANMPIG